MRQKRLVMVFLILSILLLMLGSIGIASPKFELYYKVQSGDTLIGIAREFGTSVDKLKEVNNLEDRQIKAGEEIIIPQKYEIKDDKKNTDNSKLLAELYEDNSNNNYKLKSNNTGKVIIKINKDSTENIDVSNLRTLDYYIKSGDTIYELAQEFNTSVAVIKKLNDLKESDIIKIGDQIALPINNLTPKQVISKTISREELDLLARLISGEARGESYIGQVAVGAVVLNRVVDDYFPDTIRSVIYQKGQFSPVSNGQINIKPNWTAYQAAKAALAGQDPSRGAVYFYNPKTAKTLWWLSTRDTIVKIGDHVFAK
ncbi:cell wall hydrolase [Selenihalanaerobacter shriftii]|uniref:N-acetylmuramoyl-L-alanine amidase n=1 Tax=Selenihalanaerobacter shriftii TaxID=142842 RepID=A0A1T4JNJ0_9FIRM|nr:cell wall hydrolase [Selenihalanaerobacter shriftii]SJZ31711.1 N-acetylmuramoyl-L-alanine amidase [Selenihalanaerobacter shriftii]